jgi:hypothetical protein
MRRKHAILVGNLKGQNVLKTQTATRGSYKKEAPKA